MCTLASVASVASIYFLRSREVLGIVTPVTGTSCGDIFPLPIRVRIGRGMGHHSISLTGVPI